MSGFWKSDSLVPVITLVIYFGSENWSALSLADTIKRIAEKFQLSEKESSDTMKQYW